MTRKVKNVGPPGTYKARVRSPRGISVKVEPDMLVFKRSGDEMAFSVTLKARQHGGGGGDYEFGQLIWSDGRHYVRSPIVVKQRNNNRT